MGGALHVVVLAAGRGRRMNSDLPKVLHELGGRPLLAHVVERALELGAERIHVVVGEGGELVRTHFCEVEVEWVWQTTRLGTGHALGEALPGIPDDATVLVLYGDVPLISRATLKRAIAAAAEDGLAVVTATVEEPAGYGRIIRDGAGRLTRIVEDREAHEREREVREINSGILAASARRLRGWLSRLDNDNAQGEYYLTDVVALAVADSVAVAGVGVATPEEVMGVNDRIELARLERCFQARMVEQLMRAGATLLDPARVEVRGRVQVGRDVRIDIDVILEGEVVLGDGVRIGPYTRIASSHLGARSEVYGHCEIEDARIGQSCRIGPYARLRGGAELEERARIGNFVEVKASRLGVGSKAMHLSYLGDSDLGREVNIGAGAITCNFDGLAKHRTTVGDHAFVGSGVELVAPVVVGEGATIGAGSTISKDAPAGALTVARAAQTTVTRWRRGRKGH